MKELKDYSILDIEAIDDERFKKEKAPGKWVPESRVYLKEDVDAVIAELEDNVAFWKKKLDDEMASRRDEYEKSEKEIRRLRRALLLARAERYKMREFIAREEGNLCNQMSWSRILRERTYGQWVDQLLRIANLANKLQKKCLAKAGSYK